MATESSARLDILPTWRNLNDMRTWERIERVFTDQARLDATYRDRYWAGAPLRDGHWVAFHLLEHDIHHRADLLLYLALLDIETPQVWTP
jgi:hypothetical protein